MEAFLKELNSVSSCFSVMMNYLLCNWHLRIKFVDDTTALEILPRNGVSLLNHVVSNIHQFSSEHNIMRLNPKKCNRRYYPLKIVLTITKLNKMPLNLTGQEENGDVQLKVS